MTNPTVPPVGTAGTGYAATVNAFLAEVKQRLEAAIPLSSLQIADLDMANNAITEVSHLGLYEGLEEPSTPVGSLQRFENDLYWVSAAGAAKITDGAAINSTSIGGITGDYGGEDPAQFRFVGADKTFYAYDTFAGEEWARVWARSFDVAGDASGTERVRIDWAGSGSSYTLTLPAAVPAARKLIQMGTSGALTASNVLDTDESITLVGESYYKHGNYVATCPVVYPDLVLESGTVSNNGANLGATQDPSTVVYYPLRGLQRHNRIKSIVVYLESSPGGDVTYEFALTGVSNFVAFGTADTVVASTQTTTITRATPTTLVSDASSNMFPWVKIETSSGVTAVPVWFAVTYDSP
jgi:hypothetical protein